jgi:hypothetical protein
MSAKITVVFFIAICFEIGALLVILPWLEYPSWTENYLLIATVDKLQYNWLATVVKSGYLRGAVTGLGLLNIALGLWEIINFKSTVRRFQTEWQGKEIDTPLFEAAGLRNYGPADATSAERQSTERPD